MKICSECGAKAGDYDKFCIKCGSNLENGKKEVIQAPAAIDKASGEGSSAVQDMRNSFYGGADLRRSRKGQVDRICPFFIDIIWIKQLTKATE